MEKGATAQESTEFLNKASVRLTFFGYTHFSDNLQVVSDIRRSLQDQLTRSSGKRVIYWESVGLSPEQANTQKRLIEEFGYQGTILYYSLKYQLRGANPPKKEIVRRLKETERMDSVAVLRKGYIREDLLQDFEVSRAFDGLRKKHRFAPEFEEHSPDIVAEIVRLHALENQYTQEAARSWSSRNWLGFLHAVKMAYRANSDMTVLRDGENLHDLQEKLNSMAVDKKGGSIFILFGAAHEKLGRDLQEQRPLGVQFSADIVIPNYPDYTRSAHSEMRDTGDITDDLLIRAYLCDVVNFNMPPDPKSSAYPNFARNREDVYKATQEVIETFSADEVKKLCEAGKSLYQAFKDRPLPLTLQQYVS